MLDLMEAVGRLKSIAGEHGDQLEGLSAHVVALTRSARASQQQLGRVARLLVELADDRTRIAGLEDRVEKLERKAG